MVTPIAELIAVNSSSNGRNSKSDNFVNEWKIIYTF